MPTCSARPGAGDPETTIAKAAVCRVVPMPRDPKSPLLQRRRILWALLQGLIALAISPAYSSARHEWAWQRPTSALSFTSLVLINMGLILVNRSFESSLARALLRPNRALSMLLGGFRVAWHRRLLAARAVAISFWETALERSGGLPGVGAVSLASLEFLKLRLFKPHSPIA